MAASYVARAMAVKPPMRALGLMTGTALDGFIDAALIETDGEEVQALGAWRLHPYGDHLRARLAAAVAAARAWEFQGVPPDIAAVEREFTVAHAEAVRALCADAGLAVADIDVVGLHGLTLLHRPAVKRTWQIGDAAWLARELGVAVAHDFRAADIAAGGQGAPLAPLYHAALMRRAGRSAPAAALNLGGVANVTWWGGGERLIAFDTGPANGPLNEWCERVGAGRFDRDGQLAASGRADEALLARQLAHPFFAQPYPKSLDRFDFNADMAAHLSPADGAATLTAFTGAAIGKSLDLLPARPHELIICGGGRKNPVLMREIETRAGVRAVDCDALGWRGDAIEAEAFAFLAARVLRGLPLSYPETTGAPAPMTGGKIARG